MIVLDTTVVSALMRRSQEQSATNWFDRQRPDELWTTVVSVMELRFGIERLQSSRRRRTLEQDFELAFARALNWQVLSLDIEAARLTAQIAARRYKAGRPVGLADTQIAGIAVSRGAAIATRNVRHFQDLPVQVINPWTAAG